MLLTVTGCEYQQNGEKRVYSLSNRSVVVEFPNYPTKSRLRFYDSRGYAINKASLKREMKAKVEQFKATRGIR
ncbi:hypothetical protein [Leminorella grimontii]|uniref:hypothetical protein n=1 Tax=Leminorella grimontii TaxID=82981 RepID=UPI00321FC69B